MGAALGLCRQLLLSGVITQVRAFHDVAAFNSSVFLNITPIDYCSVSLPWVESFLGPAMGGLSGVKTYLFASPQETSYNTMYTFLRGYEPRDSTTGFFIKPQAPAKTLLLPSHSWHPSGQRYGKKWTAALCSPQGPCSGSTPVLSAQRLKRDQQFAHYLQTRSNQAKIQRRGQVECSGNRIPVTPAS